MTSIWMGPAKENIFRHRPVPSAGVGIGVEALLFVFLPDEGFDLTDGHQIFLHMGVHIIILFEHGREPGKADLQQYKQRRRQYGQSDQEGAAQLPVDAYGHNGSQHHHERPPEEHPDDLRKGILQVSHIRGAAHDQRRHGELVCIGKGKGLDLIKDPLAQIFGKAHGSHGACSGSQRAENSDSREKRIINPPSTRMNFLLLAISSGEKYSRSRNSSCRYRPPSTIAAMSMGISTSMTTSQTISSGVSTVGSQYPFMHSASAPSPGFFLGTFLFAWLLPPLIRPGKDPQNR